MRYSIIIATMNAAATLERTLLAALTQSYPDREIIVQDGGSTDGTLGILRAYEKGLDWRSEPDTGLYQAWNRALARATGDWAIFLGADDVFMGGHSLAHCHRHIRALPPAIEIAYAALLQERAGGGDVLINLSLPLAYNLTLMNMGFPFPSTFIRVPFLKKHGFDERFRIAGDYDFIARTLTGGNLAKIPVLAVRMGGGGISASAGNACVLLDERGRVLFSRIAPKAGELMLACASRLWDEDPPLEMTPEA